MVKQSAIETMGEGPTMRDVAEIQNIINEEIREICIPAFLVETEMVTIRQLKIFGIISYFCKKFGRCTVSDAELADIFFMTISSPSSIKRALLALLHASLIEIHIEKDPLTFGLRRVIYLTKYVSEMSEEYIPYIGTTLQENRRLP